MSLAHRHLQKCNQYFKIDFSGFNRRWKPAEPKPPLTFSFSVKLSLQKNCPDGCLFCLDLTLTLKVIENPGPYSRTEVKNPH